MNGQVEPAGSVDSLSSAGSADSVESVGSSPDPCTAAAVGPRFSPPSLGAGLVLPVASTALTLAAGVVTGQVLLAFTVLTVPAAVTAAGIAVISHRSGARSVSSVVQAPLIGATVRPAVSRSRPATATSRALPAAPAARVLPAALALPVGMSARPAVMQVRLGGPVRSAS